MRGKLGKDVVTQFSERITPAGAGKTDTPIFVNDIAEDHPRRCGENCPTQRVFSFGLGSPPQVRGKLLRRETFCQLTRITPAGAGKTFCPFANPAFSQDHPRRCGENEPCSPPLLLLAGSPPQVRGKLDTPMEETETDRITPAGAGKTKPSGMKP